MPLLRHTVYKRMRAPQKKAQRERDGLPLAQEALVHSQQIGVLPPLQSRPPGLTNGPAPHSQPQDGDDDDVETGDEAGFARTASTADDARVSGDPRAAKRDRAAGSIGRYRSVMGLFTGSGIAWERADEFSLGRAKKGLDSACGCWCRR